MKLINPIYDASFKYIMEDQKVAKFFLEILLDKKIEIASFKPQEIIIRNTASENKSFSAPRMDFIATILETTTNEQTQETTTKRKKVLIELQQCLNASDITRFRSYLGKNYSYQDINDGKKEDLEIITIYILGFSIQTPVAVIQTSKELIDVSTKQKIEQTKDEIEWIAKLNHTSIFIDVTQLNAKIQTKVEKLLAVFNPEFRDANKTTITIPDEIISELKSLNTEDKMPNPLIQKLETALLDHEVIYQIDQQEQHILHVKNLEEKARGEGKIEGKIEGERQKAIETAKKMKAKGFEMQDIVEISGLSPQEIQNL